MRAALLIVPALLLTGCHAKSDTDHAEVTIDKTVVIKTDGDTSTVAVGGDHGFKIDTDKFKAALDIPGMTMGGKHFDVDGLTLPDGSQISGMRVVAHDKDGDKRGTVTVTFASPGTPDAVLAHAQAQANGKGWTTTRSGLTLNATKGDKTLAYVVAADGAQTKGTLTITGDDDG